MECQEFIYEILVKQILEMMYNYYKLIHIIIYFYLLFLIHLQFEFHKMYGNALELRKYADKKQHSVTCKSCRSSRSPMYCRICTFRGHNFPDIIPVHTDVSRHPGCADQYQEDIEEQGHCPHLPEKTQTNQEEGKAQ